MSNDLDELMSRDPLDLSSTDIDRIIEYHRVQRGRRAAGEKPIKATAAAGLDISAITNKLVTAAKPEVKITRRV
jgi:hypothetical protein